MYLSEKARCKVAEAQLRMRALVLAIRGHFNTGPATDATVLETLALDCVKNLDELLVADVTVVLAAIGERKIEVIKDVRSLMSLGLKEAKDLVEAAPTAIMEDIAVADANRVKAQLESAGATVALLGLK
jgi:large subunit ribosomal protein L7/L12